MPLAVPLKVSPNEQIPAARSDLSHPQLMKLIWIGYIWIGYEMPSGSSPVRPFPRVCRMDWILHVHWTLEVDKKPCGQKCIVHSYYLSIDESITSSTKYAIIRRPGSACTVFFFLCRIQNLSQNPKSKIQNPQTPKSKIPKIQNPKSPKSPKIQNPKSPRSKIQNPKSPKSKIRNPQNPKSKIPKIQNPKSEIPKIQNPKSPRSKIQNPQNPKSEIPKIQNPKSPKSKIFRQNPKFGALGASQKDLLHNDPKSKIPNPQNPKFGDFGFWIRGILDFGFGGFWILGILDLGDFGFWILDLGDFGFWGFRILLILVLLGRSRGCTTRQFGDGAWRSEARIPPGPPFRNSAKPTLSDIVGARKQIELQKPGAQEVKTIFYTFLHDF